MRLKPVFEFLIIILLQRSLSKRVYPLKCILQCGIEHSQCLYGCENALETDPACWGLCEKLRLKCIRKRCGVIPPPLFS
ncbi:hypothetical protein CLF_110079 [Clonorchis sinensis]|uniref:Uncharacterized protein n=1 Tax=Clonorchis sinensis TaxID=79923 RepID=G7YK79_CLOSI|nr:hypothetical protein CLF_110079 [Clonorchis sinensis]